MNDTSHSFFNNNDSFIFAKDSIDSELGSRFEKNSLEARLTSCQCFAPGILKGVISITAVDKLLAGKFKLKLVTNFQMRILKKKRSLELGTILNNIRSQENEAGLNQKQLMKRRESKKFWADIKKINEKNQRAKTPSVNLGNEKGIEKGNVQKSTKGTKNEASESVVENSINARMISDEGKSMQSMPDEEVRARVPVGKSALDVGEVFGGSRKDNLDPFDGAGAFRKKLGKAKPSLNESAEDSVFSIPEESKPKRVCLKIPIKDSAHGSTMRTEGLRSNNLKSSIANSRPTNNLNSNNQIQITISRENNQNISSKDGNQGPSSTPEKITVKQEITRKKQSSGRQRRKIKTKSPRKDGKESKDKENSRRFQMHAVKKPNPPPQEISNYPSYLKAKPIKKRTMNERGIDNALGRIGEKGIKLSESHLFEHSFATISTKELVLFTLTEDVDFKTTLSLPFELTIPRDYPQSVCQDLAPTTKFSFLRLLGRPELENLDLKEYVKLQHQLLVTYEADGKGKNDKVFEISNNKEESESESVQRPISHAQEKQYHYINIEIFRSNYNKKSQTYNLEDLFCAKNMLMMFKPPRPYWAFCQPKKYKPRLVKVKIEAKINDLVFYGRSKNVQIKFKIPEILHEQFNEMELILVSKKIIKNSDDFLEINQRKNFADDSSRIGGYKTEEDEDESKQRADLEDSISRGGRDMSYSQNDEELSGNILISMASQNLIADGSSRSIRVNSNSEFQKVDIKKQRSHFGNLPGAQRGDSKDVVDKTKPFKFLTGGDNLPQDGKNQPQKFLSIKDVDNVSNHSRSVLGARKNPKKKIFGRNLSFGLNIMNLIEGSLKNKKSEKNDSVSNVSRQGRSGNGGSRRGIFKSSQDPLKKRFNTLQSQTSQKGNQDPQANKIVNKSFDGNNDDNRSMQSSLAIPSEHGNSPYKRKVFRMTQFPTITTKPSLLSTNSIDSPFRREPSIKMNPLFQGDINSMIAKERNFIKKNRPKNKEKSVFIEEIKKKRITFMAMLKMISENPEPKIQDKEVKQTKKVATDCAGGRLITFSNENSSQVEGGEPKLRKRGSIIESLLSNPDKRTVSQKDFTFVDKVIYRKQHKLDQLAKDYKIQDPQKTRTYIAEINLEKINCQLQNLDTELVLIKYVIVAYLNKPGKKFENFVCQFEPRFRAVPASMNVLQKGRLSFIGDVVRKKKRVSMTINQMIHEKDLETRYPMIVLPYARVSLEK